MLSIVTGTLNRLDLLKEVIKNTIDRSDKIELVLLDGGSTDGTIEYVKSLNNERINFIEIGGRSTYPSFMNIGIKAAKHEWIVQWNDDVLLINEWDDVINMLNDGNDVYIFDWNRGTLEEYADKSYENQWICFHDCMNFGIYRKEIFRKIGMYDSQFKYYECDHDMATRCLIFGYKVVNAHNIKVMEVRTEKRCIEYGGDRAIWFKNRELYGAGIIPNTIEKL